MDGDLTNESDISMYMTEPVPLETSMALIDPELQIGTASVGRVCGSPESLRDNQKPFADVREGRPVALDAEEGIWAVEALLAKWKRGRQVLYLVKWKGFSDESNTWEKQSNIGAGLVEMFDTTYSSHGGNYLGVELLAKRTRRRGIEYLVRWKGRPESDSSWERESIMMASLTVMLGGYLSETRLLLCWYFGLPDPLRSSHNIISLQ
ncbi:hypothetical protein B0T10DRAFT_463309 [Thelonectria olida]|uniref:Chromo domain-containing protein n=1 Tax=Thelonectria olida TaxID=1576542 RepID=A0A9P8VZT0_9HYPO|nr:hypothetical protein B0T10DRAFT_463309 [Thelonectria olida]